MASASGALHGWPLSALSDSWGWAVGAADVCPGLGDFNCQPAWLQCVYTCTFILMGWALPEVPGNLSSLDMGQPCHSCVYPSKLPWPIGSSQTEQGQVQRQPPILLLRLVLLTRPMADSPATLRGTACPLWFLQHEWQFTITDSPFPAQRGLQF